MPDFEQCITDGKETAWLRPKTTRRYLHPPKADRMFTLWAEGKILFGENVPGEDYRYYPTIESYAIWPVYSRHDRQFDFRRVKMRTTESGAPVHGQSYEIGGCLVEEEAFSEIAEHPTCFIRFRLTNTAPYAIEQRFGLYVRRGPESEIAYGSPDCYTSYLPEVGPFKALPVTFTYRDGVLRDGDVFVTIDSPLPVTYDAGTGALYVQAALKKGESRDVVLSFGKGKPRDFSYRAERAAVEEYWEKELSRINRLPKSLSRDPETVRMIRHLVAEILQCFCRHTDNPRPILRQGGLQRLIWPWDAMPAIEALGRIGDFGPEIEAILHTYFSELQEPSGEIKNLGENWASVTACCLYSLATYCLQKNDPLYWQRYRDRALRAFRWIESERARSEGIPGAVAGLMPPLRGNDWQDVFQHWTFTDCLTVGSYHAFLRAAEAFADPAAEGIKIAYDSYRNTVLEVLKKSPGFSGEGPFRIPLLPMGDDREILDKFHPYVQIILPVLELHDLLPENTAARVKAWAEKVGLIENGLHGRMPGRDGNTHVFYTTAPDYDWFFLYLMKGRREEAKEIIDSSIRYSMTEEYYMIERYDSGDPYFVPWSPNVSAAGRLLNMLLDYENDRTAAADGTAVLKHAGHTDEEPSASEITLTELPYVDVIIFGGQSNMQGQSDALTDAGPVAGAYEFKWLTDSFKALQSPVGENIKYNKTAGEAVTASTDLANWVNSHVLGASCYGNTNLVPKFCENYIAETGANVVAVHAAKGSTKIEGWLPGTPGYEMLVEKAQAAVAKAGSETVVRHVWFVWLQGESNALAKTSKDSYKTSLATLNDALKQDVGIEKFGVIRVGRFANNERDDVIMAAQDEICTEDEDFLMLTTIAADLNTEARYKNLNVAGHFSALGLEKLGEAAGKSLGTYVKTVSE